MPRKWARKINKTVLNLTLETGAAGKAFGSVTVKDLEEALAKALPDVTVERHAIQLEKPIKETGDHEVPVRHALGSHRQAAVGRGEIRQRPRRARGSRSRRAKKAAKKKA